MKPRKKQRIAEDENGDGGDIVRKEKKSKKEKKPKEVVEEVEEQLSSDNEGLEEDVEEEDGFEGTEPWMLD